MKNFLILIETIGLVLLVGIFLFMFSGVVQAKEFKVLEVQDLNIKYYQYFPGGSSPLVTQNGLKGKTMDKAIKLQMNTNIFRYLYWDNIIHTNTDKNVSGRGSQFRTIGWNFMLGIMPFSWLQLEYEHHSQHILDSKFALGRFPVEDSIGFKLNFITNEPRKGWF